MGLSPEPQKRELAPGFPIRFAELRLAALSWERDAVHMPAALSPLASDYALVLGNSLNDQYPLRMEGFPQRWHAAVWHGFVYYAFERNATDEEWAAISARMDRLWLERAEVTEAYWDDEVLPELRAIYERIDAIDARHTPGDALADAWDGAWRDVERAWQLHMDVTPGVYRILDELHEAYAVGVPGATRGDASRLLQGSDNELVAVDRATDELAAIAEANPAIREALRAGARSFEALEILEGGPSFVAAVTTTLTVHGHLGQLADDLEMASFGEQPELYVAEIAKRLDGSAIGTTERSRQLRHQADELVEQAMTALSSNPEALRRFEVVLALARRVGPLSERHNYWIDRAALAHLRRLAIRVGRRLVFDGVIEHHADVFYLRRAEVGSLLRAPRNQRSVVARRRKKHQAASRINPMSRIGSSPTSSDDRPHFTPPEPSPAGAGFQGTGASPGVARGPARVVLDLAGFARVNPGDIIVCHSSNTSFVPIFSIAGGLITNVGGLLSHAAIVAREFGLPAVVGLADATARIADGQELEIDGTQGTVRLLSANESRRTTG
jgi:pyruvate,water dikinase